MTNEAPLALKETGKSAPASAASADSAPFPLPDDPGQEILPLAQIEPAPPAGAPVRWEARRQSQSRTSGEWVLEGDVVGYYDGYVLHASKVIYHPSSSEVEVEGPLSLDGGPEDIHLTAERGDLRINMHTARFFNVHGSLGVRTAGRTTVYSTANPFRFSGRVLLQMGDGNYRIVDGAMTNCRLPRPDWQIISRSIDVSNRIASTRSSSFRFLGIPLFYLPYLRHPIDDTGRESGLLIPVVSNSSIKGFIVGEQAYWAINRSMDMVVGSEYFSKRGWAPNGDFRYKGAGDDHLLVRWNALFDRGVEQAVAATATTPASAVLVNQGGVDVAAQGRKDLGAETRVAGIVEYLSSYVYRLVFNDNFSQAISSEVASNVSLTHSANGLLPSVSLERFQAFANSVTGAEVRIIHLPNARYDALDRPLGDSPFYAGASASVGYLNRSEPHFHARNLGRMDLYPHLSLPLNADGWSLVPALALRNTFYSASQYPDLTGARNGVPSIRHELLDRADVEASADLRPPVLLRDFSVSGWNRILRHVIEPQISYRYVNGIGYKAQNVIRTDTTDIAADTNELGYSLTQRLYLRPIHPQPCAAADGAAPGSGCPPPSREWASWQIAQKYYFDPSFHGALIPGRRNVFDTTLDLTPISFLTKNRNLSPVISRMRFEAIDNLRIEWDLDYDPKAGRMGADNVFAGYSFGRTTVGIGHALLNAVDEAGSSASTIKSQQLQPFFTIGKPTRAGFNLAANGGYDFVQGQVQYAGVQANYNWNCCGLSFGYRRFELGSVRDETQYLYSFTIANFGSVGDIRRTNSVFRDPSLPPAY